MQNFTVTDLSKRFSMPSYKIRTHIKLGRFPNAFKHPKTGHYYIPESNVIDYENTYLNSHISENKLDNYLNFTSSMKFLGVGYKKMHKLLQSNAIPMVRSKNSRGLLIHRTHLHSLLDALSTQTKSARKAAKVSEDSLQTRALTVKEISARLGMTDETVRELIRHGSFPEVIRIKSRYYVPLTGVEAYEKEKAEIEQRSTKYLTLAEVSSLFNISKKRVNKLIKDGIIKVDHHFKRIQDYLISQHTVDNLILYIQNFNKHSYMTLSDACIKLYLTKSEIHELVLSGKLPQLITNKVTGKVFISRDSVLSYKADLKQKKKQEANNRPLQTPEGYVTLEEAAARISRHPSILQSYMRTTEYFLNTVKIAHVRYISEIDIEAFLKDQAIPDGYLTVQQVCEKLSKDDSSILPLIHKGVFPNAYFCDKLRRYLIPSTDLQKYINDKKIPAGFLHVNTCLDILSCSKEELKHLIKDNIFKTVKINLDGEMFLLEEEIITYKRLQEIPSDYLTLDKVSKELGCSILEVQSLLGAGVLKSVTGESLGINYDKTLVSKQYVDSYKKVQNSNHSLQSIELYNDKLGLIKGIDHVSKTVELYNKFSLNTINATRGTRKTFQNVVSGLIRTLKYLIPFLNKDIFLFSDNELENILNKESIPDTYKQCIIRFFTFCQSSVKCSFKRIYKIKYKNSNRLDKDIYDKETFLNFYTHTANVDIHLNRAVEQTAYAQTWLYALIHMTNGWRKSTILSQMPNLQIEEIDGLNVYSLDFFMNNRLSAAQAQSIINYYYSACGKIFISKTNSLGQFLCNQDLVIPMATALLVCEFHKRKQSLNTLLGSPNLYGNSHKRFKAFFNDTQLPIFNSLKMNRSLLTHFFYTVTESGIHPEVSLKMSKNLRAHKDENSTSLYIQATNKDGPLDKVSLNLFNRGHFGWLYNFMVDLALGETTQALESQTRMIQLLSNDYTPSELEDLSQFLLKRQTDQVTIMDKLNHLPKTELKELVIKILKGEMPAKAPNAQCLTYPVCNYEVNRNCFGCDNVIPKSFLLLSIVEEVKHLVTSLRQTNYDAVRYRDTLQLIKVMDLVHQAIEELGHDMVSTFIDFKAFQNLIAETKKYMLIKKPEIKYLESSSHVFIKDRGGNK